MKKIITAVFSDLDNKNKNIRLELDSSLSPMTVQAILDHLPVKSKLTGGEMNSIWIQHDLKDHLSRVDL